jgi:hypothetical protein
MGFDLRISGFLTVVACAMPVPEWYYRHPISRAIRLEIIPAKFIGWHDSVRPDWTLKELP